MEILDITTTPTALSDEFAIAVYPNDMVKAICYLERDQNIPVYEPAFDPNIISKHITIIEQHRTHIELLEISLHKGLNLFSYPLDYPHPYYAGQFLNTHDPDGISNGPEWFLGMRYYHNSANSQETCYFVFSERVFNKIRGAYALYMKKAKVLSFPSPPPNQPITLKEGINWVGVPSPPPGYTSYVMLQEIGAP